MTQSHSRFIDPKGFYEMFRHREKAKNYSHVFYYPKDIVRNELSLLEQEVKKEKWKVFNKTMDFISIFDKQYDPLGDCKLLGDRMNKLMTHFATVMETLNKKKIIFIKNNPGRAREVLERIASRPMLNP